jgi:L-threonylcarbamoyladenylate synthase
MLSKSGDMKEAAANLYQALHQLDNIDIELIIAEKFPMNGLGNTINDRLARATKNK